MPGECRCSVCHRLFVEYKTNLKRYEETTPLPDRFRGMNSLSWAALEWARCLQRSIDHHSGRQELHDGRQDGLQAMDQQQQQQMQAQYAQLQAPQEQVVPGVVPVNSMANHQLLHAAENAVVDGNAHAVEKASAAENTHAAENAQGPGNPYNMPPQLPYQHHHHQHHHHHHHHAPAVGQFPLGHAAPGPALAAPPPPPRPTPAQLAPVTSQAAEQVRSNNQWHGQPPGGPPPGPAAAPKTLPRGTFVRALVAPTAHRLHYMARCARCVKRQDVCTAHYSWPCTECKGNEEVCVFERPTNFVAARIDPAGYNLGHDFTVREVSGRLEDPPHELLTHLKQEQKNNPAY